VVPDLDVLAHQAALLPDVARMLAFGSDDGAVADGDDVEVVDVVRVDDGVAADVGAIMRR